MQSGGYVYIMASPSKSVLYIGVTANLYERVFEHRNKYYPTSSTTKYNCVILVYYQGFDRIEEAIAEEKRLKGGNRKSKEEKIGAMNTTWKDVREW